MPGKIVVKKFMGAITDCEMRDTPTKPIAEIPVESDKITKAIYVAKLLASLTVVRSYVEVWQGALQIALVYQDSGKVVVKCGLPLDEQNLMV